MSGAGETFRYNVLDAGTQTPESAHYNIQYSSSNGGAVSVKLVRHFQSELSNIYIEMNFLRDILIFILHSLSHKITFKTCSLQIVFAFKRQTSKTKLSGLPWIVSDNWSLNISFSYQCHFFSNVFSQCLFN